MSDTIPIHYVCTHEDARKMAFGHDRFWVSNCGCDGYSETKADMGGKTSVMSWHNSPFPLAEKTFTIYLS